MTDIPQFTSVFDYMKASAYPYLYEGEIGVKTVCGGVPSDPHVIDGWLRSKIGLSKEEDIKAQVAAIAIERDIPEAEAAAELAKNRSLNGFLRERCSKCPRPRGSEPLEPMCEGGKHQLKLSGRQLKACLKEAANIAVAAGKLPSRGWGTTNKGLLSFFAEHFFIIDDDLLLEDSEGNPIFEPTGIKQNFVHSRFGSAVQYQEYVEAPKFSFSVIADYLLEDEEWGIIWSTGQQNGIGASRSRGYGRFAVTQWDNHTPPEVIAKGKPKKIKELAGK